MKKLSPIIAVEEIEPCLPFWTERLGFEVTVTVPHEDRLGFVIVEKDGVQVMYQSRASIDADIPGIADRIVGQTATLFIEVDAIDPVEEAMAGVEFLIDRRQTFYGMDEIFVLAPCGTVVGFAAQVDE